eukprot:TRINITY_DN11318_c0_g1_i1.p1 TRINITY_DN11318_c0_g1~~TRINITY_DN11318_c0_g1_i1.p1  ORF type:complete len:324 (+),score=61.02 TRINITY_DN11318_c0_g1_i1:48-1019(+)
MSLDNDDRVSSNHECRICRMGEENESLLINPCECRGTVAFVHATCLSQWLQTQHSTANLFGDRPERSGRSSSSVRVSNTIRCEICNAPYRLMWSRSEIEAQDWRKCCTCQHEKQGEICGGVFELIGVASSLPTLLFLGYYIDEVEGKDMESLWVRIFFGFASFLLYLYFPVVLITIWKRVEALVSHWVLVADSRQRSNTEQITVEEVSSRNQFLYCYPRYLLQYMSFGDCCNQICPCLSRQHHRSAACLVIVAVAVSFEIMLCIFASRAIELLGSSAALGLMTSVSVRYAKSAFDFNLDRSQTQQQGNEDTLPLYQAQGQSHQ